MNARWTGRQIVLSSVAVLLVGAGVASAETSSWEGRTDGPAAPIERKAPAAKPGQIKTIKTVPQAGGTQAPAPAPPPEKSSSYAKQSPAGDDAAYEAFDQGQYVTALQLAVKGAERGEPQAHTLIGRIYAEGLGTSKNTPLAAQWYARGAELGDPEAMFAYGLMLAEGKGVEEDRVAAGRYFEAAAAKQASARELQSGAAVPERRRQAREPASRPAAHAFCGRVRRRNCAIRPRHHVCHRPGH